MRRVKVLLLSRGGEIKVLWSEPGKGSAFQVRIPVSSVSGVGHVGRELGAFADGGHRSGREKQEDLKGLRVLLVEDSPDNQMLVSMYLRKTGAILSKAENGLKGVEMALAENPDVVLMDIQMPVMDGHEATKSLRTQGFAKPIVALTAHAMKEERDRCFASGCTDYLTKPLERDRLINYLKKHCRVTEPIPT
jgi:CheY-like chemotaxis protein